MVSLCNAEYSYYEAFPVNLTSKYSYVVRFFFFFVVQIYPGVLGKGEEMCQMAKLHKTNYLGNFVGKMHCDTGVRCSL